MKSDSNKRLMKLISVETLIQLGFENSTEQALSTLADVFGKYIEMLARKLSSLRECSNPNVLSRFLIEDTYYEEFYQIKELSSFLNQQIELKRYLKNTYEVEDEETLLHLLKVLPKDANIKSVFKSSKSSSIEEKKSLEIKEDIEIDGYMADFIEKSSSEQSRRRVGDYQSDCSVIVEKISNGDVLIEYMNAKSRDRIFNYKDPNLAVQELFIEDFFGNEKYSVMR